MISWLNRVRQFQNGLEFVATVAAVASIFAFLLIAVVALMRIPPAGDLIAAAHLEKTSELNFMALELVHAANQEDRYRTFIVGRQTTVELAALMPLLDAAEGKDLLTSRLEELALELEPAWRAIGRTPSPSAEAFVSVRTVANRLVFQLKTVNMLANKARDASLLAQTIRMRTVVGGLLACLATGLVSAGFIAFRLVQSLRRARRAEAMLFAQANALEATVAKRTEELWTAEVRLRQAISSAPDAFLAYDGSGKLFVANELGRQLLSGSFGLDDKGPLSAVLSILGSPEYQSDFECEMPDGGWYKISIRRAGDGATVLRFADIGLEKQALRSAQLSLARERRLTRLAKDFVAMVSHQFRTPLAIIDSGAQRLMRWSDGLSAAEIRERAIQIRKAAAGLNYLVDGALDTARLETGEMNFNPTEIDLGMLVADLCAQIGELHPHRELAVDLDQLPSLVVCDPHLIDQALTNLLTNAFKYSREGSVIVVQAAYAPTWVSISVTDEGIGIPEDEIEKVFEPAYRASNVRDFEGIGLGLHVSRRIARMHGGDVSARSSMGRTTLTFRIPFGATSRMIA